MDLSTNYMGLKLKSPIIIGSSNLTTEPKMLKKLEEAGAGAVVYKSLFEEQLHLENLHLSETMNEFEGRHSEMSTIFPEMIHGGPTEYLAGLKKAKEAVNIPVIASLNAVYDESWIKFAKIIENAGIDGIELNLYTVPKDMDTGAIDIIDWQIDILKKIRKELNIPIAIKLSPYYSNPLNLIKKMDDAGADAFVLFNRFFQPDINIDTEELIFPRNLSSDGDYRLALRFMGLLYNQIDAKLCGSRGVYDGADMIKMLLAGADSVQVVSTVIKNGPGQVKLMLDQMSSWMEKKKYNSIADFQGKLSKQKINDDFAYHRAQYIDIVMNYKDLFKKYPFV